jgi:hypothetical protein
MQAGRVLPRTRWLNPHREPAQPAPQVRIAQADNAALPAVPSGAASPHLFLPLRSSTSADAGGNRDDAAELHPAFAAHRSSKRVAVAAISSGAPLMAQGEVSAGKVFDSKPKRSF